MRWSPHLLASAGYVVLLTDYTGSVGYGEEFSRLIQGDPLKTPGDEVLEAADEAVEPSGRVAVVELRDAVPVVELSPEE
mgnify:CR=1 FL=1